MMKNAIESWGQDSGDSFIVHVGGGAQNESSFETIYHSVLSRNQH
jgi:hypothetical protein